MSLAVMRPRFSAPLTSPTKTRVLHPVLVDPPGDARQIRSVAGDARVQLESPPLDELHGLQRLVHSLVRTDARQEEDVERPRAATARRNGGHVHGGERIFRHRRRRRVDRTPVPPATKRRAKPGGEDDEGIGTGGDAAKARPRRPSISCSVPSCQPRTKTITRLQRARAAWTARPSRTASNLMSKLGVTMRTPRSSAPNARRTSAVSLASRAAADGAPSSPRRLPTTSRRASPGRYGLIRVVESAKPPAPAEVRQGDQDAHASLASWAPCPVAPVALPVHACPPLHHPRHREVALPAGAPTLTEAAAKPSIVPQAAQRPHDRLRQVAWRHDEAALAVLDYFAVPAAVAAHDRERAGHVLEEAVGTPLRVHGGVGEQDTGVGLPHTV